MTGRSAVRWARRLGLLAALVVAVYAVTSQWSEISDAMRRLGVLAVLLSFLSVLCGLGASALSWRALLVDAGEPLSYRQAGRVFFLGQLAKYLPGGVWSVVAQVELGRDAGVARAPVATTAVVVMGVNVTTGLAVAACALPLAADDVGGRWVWSFALLPVGVAALHPRVLTRLVGAALRLLRQPALSAPLTWRGVGGAVGWALVMWAAYGVHLHLLLDPVVSGADRLGLLAVGAYALAWTVGFLTVVAPAGAAAREAMLVAALSSALATGPATAVALVSRALMTAGDMVWAALATGIRGVPDMSRSARPG